MKSKRAEEFINNRSELIDGLEWMVDASTARRAVELAEQDAEEEIEDILKLAGEECKGFVEILETLQEEHEQQIEALKKRAVEAFGSLDFTEFMTAECVQDFDNVKCKLRGLFIQKLNDL